MKETIYNLLAQQGDMTWQQIIMHILVSAVIGLFIFISYVISHKGTIYSKKFGVTLIVLTVMTGTVMTVIGNNIALSLGMVGALSIVRFRTAIKDSRDTVYIFWTIIVGICCGVGDYLVAAVGSSAIFLIFLIMGAIRSDNRMLLIIRAKRSRCENIESQVFRYFGTGVVLRVKNTTLARNDARWGSVEQQAKGLLVPVSRNLDSRSAAEGQLKGYLRNRGKWLDENIETLRQYSASSRVKQYNEVND